jgi:hypothetical protein
MTALATDRHGNTHAQEGVRRCWCGSKYWELDKCVDCGEDFDPRFYTADGDGPFLPHEFPNVEMPDNYSTGIKTAERLDEAEFRAFVDDCPEFWVFLPRKRARFARLDYFAGGWVFYWDITLGHSRKWSNQHSLDGFRASSAVVWGETSQGARSVTLR